jgi:hypothetical protein
MTSENKTLAQFTDSTYYHVALSATGSTNRVQETNSYLLFKYTPFLNSFYWALLNYNTSFSLKINNESQGGLGFAYSLIDTKNAYLNFSDGVVYDQSNLLVPDSIPYSYHTYRNFFRLTFHFSIKGVIILDGSHYLQNSFKQGNDYVIRANTSLTFKLRKWIGLTTVSAYNKMNRSNSENLHMA